MKKYLSLILLLLIIFGCSANRNSSYLAPPKPILVKTVPPVYPESLNNKDIKGEVWVKVELLTDGSVGAAEIEESLDSDLLEFDEAALNAIKQWRFAPIIGDFEESFSQKIILPVKFNSEQIPVDTEDVQNTQIPTYESPPEVIKRINPEYPIKMRKRRIQGSVGLHVEVLANGDVGRVEVKKSLFAGSGGFDEAAINAVKQWKFSPAKSNEKPVDSWAAFDIFFKLY